MTKFWIVICMLGILLIFLASFGGTFYWLYTKAKRVSESLSDAAKKSQSFTTPSSTASSSKTPSGTLSMPASDVEGQDLADVPRYPNSLRDSFDQAKDGSQYIVEYFAQESSNKIFDYYKKTLQEKGWVLNSADPTSLNFSKTDAEATIEIVDEDKTTSVTWYRIQYIRTPTETEEE